MTTDLYVLALLGALAFVLQNAAGVSRFVKPGGLAWGIGNREQADPLEPWAARADRAHKNLLENLPHYSMIVLVVAVAGRADAVSATASLVYLGARIAHAIVYTAGITYVRTAAYYTGIAAELVIASRLF